MTYRLPARPVDSWRTYDEKAPDPGYFEFDWLSARHPDLYHAFARSTDGAMHELDALVDLTGLVVADIGAGTGRSTVLAARKAEKVVAIDAYESVAAYGQRNVRGAGLNNVSYVIGDSEHLPLADDSVDAAVSAWAQMDFGEAHRVLRPNGYLIQVSAAPGALCGELTGTLAPIYPELITEVAPTDRFDRSCASVDALVEGATWNGVPLAGPRRPHDFTCLADFGDTREASQIFGRVYGPAARAYIQRKGRPTVAYRLRVSWARVRE